MECCNQKVFQFFNLNLNIFWQLDDCLITAWQLSGRLRPNLNMTTINQNWKKIIELRINIQFFSCQNRLVEVKIQWSEENLIIASDFKYYVIVLGRQRKNWQTSLSYFASGSSISLSSWFIGFKADWGLSFASTAVILRISKALFSNFSQRKFK